VVDAPDAVRRTRCVGRTLFTRTRWQKPIPSQACRFACALARSRLPYLRAWARVHPPAANPSQFRSGNLCNVQWLFLRRSALL